jgi:hypothetical protein
MAERFKQNLNDYQASSWLSIPEVSYFANVPRGSLHVLLPRWQSWQYVISEQFQAEATSDRRPHEFYQITGRGIAFVEKMASWYELFDKAVKEVNERLDAEEEQDFISIEPVLFIHKSTVPLLLKWPFNSGRDINVTIAHSGWRHIARTFPEVESIIHEDYNRKVTREFINEVLSALESEMAERGYRVKNLQT